MQLHKARFCVQAFEIKCLRKLLCISYLEHKTNVLVWSKINSFVDQREPFLAIVKRQKLEWLEHVTRHDSLSKTILQDTMVSGRCRGRQRKCWTDNVKSWRSLPVPTLLLMVSQKRLEEDLCWFISHVPPTTQSIEAGLN